MSKTPSLQVEECWSPGARLSLEHAGDGRVRLRGNHDGLVGLARTLLWLAQYRTAPGEMLELSSVADFGDGPVLEVGGPQDA